MSNVRFAQIGDIPALVELGREIHAKSRYAWMPFDANRLWLALEIAIQDSGQCVIVASDYRDLGARVFAGIWAKVVAPEFTREFFADVVYLYSRPERRGSPSVMKMLVGMRTWARNRKCCCIRISRRPMPAHLMKTEFLERLGFQISNESVELWLPR